MNNVVNVCKSCCGCRSCEQICPQKCIKIVQDKEGFLVPEIDREKCTGCGVCVKKCPQIQEYFNEEKIQEVYAAKTKAACTALHSSSGGIFPVLAEYVLDNAGKVYGCMMDKDFNVSHIGIEKKEDLYLLRGSKYVQSNTKSTYSEVKKDLLAGKLVLFSGTGCQVAGLNTFLGKKYDNLLTVDVICHGVPSHKMFKKYIDWLSNKIGSSVTRYEFRNKEKNRWGLTAKVETKEKVYYKNGKLDPYYRAFLDCKIYRECCYQCKYANENRVSDITLGDYWGIEKQHPDFYTDTGVSVIILNSLVGKKYFEAIKEDITYISSSYNKAAEQNANLINPSKRPQVRDEIYEALEEMKLDNYFSKYLKVNDTKEQIKTMVPYELKKTVKRLIKR